MNSRAIQAKLKRKLKEQLIRHMRPRWPQRSDLPLANWSLSRDEGGDLYLRGKRLSELPGTYGSPLFIVDMAALIQNCHDLMPVTHEPIETSRKAATPVQLEVFSSYKTNPIPEVLSRIHSCSVGAEVISEYELWLALQLGVPPEKIIYNGPAKSDASIALAIEKDILSLNVNHREEIPRIAALAEKLGRRPRVSIRVSMEGNWGGQLGIPTAGGEALAAFAEAQKNTHLRLMGVHCHRGHTIEDQATLKQHLEQVLHFCAELHHSLGFTVEHLNIGGSIGIPSVRALQTHEKNQASAFLREPLPPDLESRLSLAEYRRTAVEVISQFFREQKQVCPRIFCEPGRALTGNTQHLLASVMQLRRDKDFIYGILDAGINLCSPLPSEFHQLYRLREPQTEHARKHVYRFVGPICHMGDTIYRAWTCSELTVNDLVLIMDTGAYFIPEGNSFSFPQPGVVALEASGDLTLIRRAQTFADMIERDCIGEIDA